MMVEQLTLNNGLRTCLVNSESSQVVSVQIWFKAGSSLEKGDDLGMAHFLEHMFFKGTIKYPKMMIAKTVESFGGEINAFTSFDYTCYYINAPADKLLTTIDVLLDMVCNPMFELEELIPEREVVYEEFLRSVDNPNQYNFSKMQTQFFPKDYSHPILGEKKTIKNFQQDQLRAFWKKYYNLENSLLIVAGNLLETKHVIDLINKFQLPHGEYSHFSEFKLKQKASLDFHKKAVNQVTLTLGIQAPEYTAHNAVAEDLAMNCLAHGDISPLYIQLVTQTSLASSVSGSTMFMAKGGAHFLRVSFPLENFRAALKELCLCLEQVLNQGFSQDELERIRNQYIASKVYEKETIESYAFGLGHGFAQNGNIDCEDEFIKEMKKLSPQNVHVALCEIFRRPIHASIQGPEEFDQKKYDQDMKNFHQKIQKLKFTSPEVKAYGNLTTSKFDKTVQLIQLRSNIKLIYRQNLQTPTFALHCYLHGGLIEENDQSNGIYNLLAKNLTYGYKGKDYLTLKNELDKKSSYLNGFSARNAYGLTLHGLSEYFNDLTDDFLLTLLHPQISMKYLKLEKELIKRNLHLQKEDPLKQCFKLFNQIIFHKHPYSREIAGNEKTIGKISRKDICELHEKNLKSKEILLTYCGDLSLDQVVKKISDYFPEKLNAKGTKKFLAGKSFKMQPLKNQKRSLNFDREQTHIVIGKSAYKPNTNEDIYLKIFTTFLSGQSSELFVEVRDRQGLCYSVQALHNVSVDGGYWGIYIGTSADKKDQAITAIFDLINRFAKNGLTKDDFEQVKIMMHGQNILNTQTNDDFASFYSIPVLHQLGLDFPHLTLEKINKAKYNDFNLFCKKFLVGEWNVVEVGRPS